MNEEERLWALVMLGYHVASTISFFIDISGNKTDYAGSFNMLAHHLATCLLYFGGITMNYIYGGLAATFLCDSTDVFFSLSRLFNYTIYENVTTAVFVINLFTWAYGRLYCFTFFVTWQAMAWENTDLLENGGWFAMYCMRAMLVVLVLLNYIWYWMML